jgi:CBS domain-containing protein
MMVEKNVSSLMVIENEKLIGIFTERDYARKVILKGKSSRETPIEDIMTGKLITVSSSTTIDECMKLMSGNFIRHLPVVDDDNIVGLVSIGDLVRHIIEEQKFIIENMGNYIAGA